MKEVVAMENIQKTFVQEENGRVRTVIFKIEGDSKREKTDRVSISNVKTSKCIEKKSEFEKGGGTFSVIIKDENIPPQTGRAELTFTLDALIEQAKNEFKLL